MELLKRDDGKTNTANVSITSPPSGLVLKSIKKFKFKEYYSSYYLFKRKNLNSFGNINFKPTIFTLKIFVYFIILPQHYRLF